MFGLGLGKLGGQARAAGFAPAYSPLSLFANGEQGAWYDPSDLSTMFQDSAGTIPVTSDGQPVGLILDKSGRGNHASQVTSTARPLYKTDGAYHWLQFDGVDDSLSTAQINFTSTDKMSGFYGLSKSSIAQMIFCELGPNLNLNSGCFYMSSLGATDTTTNAKGAIPEFGNPVNYVDSWSGAGVYSQLIDLTYGASSNKLRKNGIQVGINNSDLGGGTFRSDALYIGSRSENGLPVNGNIYSLIVRGALSTPEEITETETWVNGKTGAY